MPTASAAEGKERGGVNALGGAASEEWGGASELAPGVWREGMALVRCLKAGWQMEGVLIYLLYLYKSTNADSNDRVFEGGVARQGGGCGCSLDILGPKKSDILVPNFLHECRAWESASLRRRLLRRCICT